MLRKARPRFVSGAGRAFTKRLRSRCSLNRAGRFRRNGARPSLAVLKADREPRRFFPCGRGGSRLSPTACFQSIAVTRWHAVSTHGAKVTRSQPFPSFDEGEFSLEKRSERLWRRTHCSDAERCTNEVVSSLVMADPENWS